MLSELNRLVETFWLVVPIALAAGCFILGGLAALILGRIGELLGYILLGSGRSALVGAWVVSALAGLGFGAAFGAWVGVSFPLGPELLLTSFWASIGLILGSFSGSWTATPSDLNQSENPTAIRLSQVVAQFTGTDLETFLCTAFGIGGGVLLGGTFGVMISFSEKIPVVVGLGLGLILGLGIGAMAGWIGSNHGHVFRMLVGMVVGVCLCGFIGSAVAAYGKGAGEWISGAITGAVTCAGCALILAERLYHIRRDTDQGGTAE